MQAHALPMHGKSELAAPIVPEDGQPDAPSLGRIHEAPADRLAPSHQLPFVERLLHLASSDALGAGLETPLLIALPALLEPLACIPLVQEFVLIDLQRGLVG